MSNIDSLSLMAQKSYNAAQERPQVNSSNSINNSQQFSQMVEKNFNDFARLSPTQIQERIMLSKNTVNNVSGNSNFASKLVSNVKTTLETYEDQSRKSLIGESSLTELLTSANKAKNTLESTVKLRQKFLEACDKVLNMSM